MSAPSMLHEDRVADLEVLADLAGFAVPVQLYARRLPDVTRVHRSRPSLLVADAKATEVSSCTQTRGRLSEYLRRSRIWCEAGFDVHVLVCHDPSSHGWNSALEDVATRSGYAVLSTQTWSLGEKAVVTGACVEWERRAQRETQVHPRTQVQGQVPESWPAGTGAVVAGG